MLRKSLFLSLAAVLVVSLMFTGCPPEIEYRDVPGPEVQVPGPEVEVPGPTVEVPGPEVEVPYPVPGPEVQVPYPVPEPYPDPYPVPGPEVPYYVVADVTVPGSVTLEEALKDPAYKIIALTSNPGVLVEDLEIPAGKSLWLYDELKTRPGYTIDVKGEVIVAYGGSLVVRKNHPVTVTGSGSITVQQTGILETDVAESVNNGGGSTALGTPNVKIDGYAATLKYTDPPENLGLIKTAYDNYFTKGYLEVQGFKLSELVTIPDPAAVGIKLLKATALTSEDAEELTVPANALLTAKTGDPLGGVTTLVVNGSLDTGLGNSLQALTALTINGRLTTQSDLVKVANVDLGIHGDLVDSTALFKTLTELTVKGEVTLPSATFDNLKTLTINEKGKLTAGVANFSKLVNLTIAKGGEFISPGGTFDLLTNADLGNKLVVDGNFTASSGAAALFKGLKGLEVNGELTLNGTASAAFAAVTELKVTGKLTTDATAAFAGLLTLNVENGGKLTVTGAGTTTLNKVETLTVDGTIDATGTKWTALATLTVPEGREFIVPAAATLAKVKDLTLNGKLNAPGATFGTPLLSPIGTGELVAGGNVANTGATSKALLLFNSDLASVSLGNTTAIATDITVPLGKTRIFTGAGGNLTGSITVNNGGTLILGAANTVLASLANKTITVSGTLAFNGTAAAPGGPITVKNGGQVAFNGTVAAPGGPITVETGGVLSFDGGAATLSDDITVDGELVVGDGTTLTLTTVGKTFAVNGVLRATDLEARGVSYQIPGTGGSLVIAGKLSGGSTIAATLTVAGTNSFEFAPGAYIRDTYYRNWWTLDGGNRDGSFNFTLAAGKILTLGGGKILTTDALKLPLNSPVNNPPNPNPAGATGYVTLGGNASIIVHKYTGPNGGNTIGLELSFVIIDLTDSGSIVVEPGAKLTLAKATAATAIAGAGVITTKRNDSTAGYGVVGGIPVWGNLTKLSGGGNLANLNTAGVIGGGNSIDQGDEFSGNGSIVVTPGYTY